MIAELPAWIFYPVSLTALVVVFGFTGAFAWAQWRDSRPEHNDGHVFTPDDLGDQGHPSYTCAICGKRKAEHSDGADDAR